MKPDLATSFRDVRILYLRELRAALREKGIVINSLLVPMLLYPVLLWVLFTAMTFVRGQQERFVSRVAVFDLPASHEELIQRLEEDEDGRFELADAADPDAAADAVTAGDLDLAVLAVAPSEDAAALEHNVAFELVFDASKDRSETARYRFEGLVAEYRRDWLERSAASRGIGQADWELLDIDRKNVASGEDMGGFVLGLMVPILMIFMIAVGCFYPAVDATAGERERNTWETLMTVSASRTSIVVAKYLYVATLGAVAGLLNLLAMTVSMRSILAPILGSEDRDLSFEIPFEALPLMALSALLLALFIAAGMMLFASFARTFKEGQSMIGPFYLVCLLPPMLVNSPDIELTAGWAMVPVANVSLLIRGLFGGQYPWDLIGLVFVVEVASIVLLLAAVRWVLSFEDVLHGSTGGDLFRFLKEKIGRKKTASAETGR